MADFDPSFQRNLYLSPDQQDLLLAALSSNNQSSKPGTQAHLGSTNGSASHELFDSPPQDIPGSGHLGFEADDSPFLGLDLDAEFDLSDQALIGDIPDADEEQRGHREKRKSLDGPEDTESGKKRKENEDKVAKKPGRKPLTSEPTTKRKAQNRAAQRAFRDRKEKHLKDLETKVEDLERASKNANHENTLLRAHVQRLQVELKEYRKRLSWISSGNSLSPTNSLLHQARNLHAQSRINNDFSFDFPKFGDLPGAHIYNGNGSLSKGNSATRSQTHPALGIKATSHLGTTSQFAPTNGRLFRPNVSATAKQGSDTPSAPYNTQTFENPAVPFSESPSASSESQHISSICTSPESNLTSPTTAQRSDTTISAYGKNQIKPNATQCELKFYERLGEACGCVDNPIPAALVKQPNQLHRAASRSESPEKANTSVSSPKATTTASTSTLNTQSALTQSDTTNDKTPSSSNVLPEPSIPSFDWLAQQNGGHFDPVLFGDYRDPQDAVLSQEFSGFFDDAFPLPDLSGVEAFDTATPGSTGANGVAKTLGKPDQPILPTEIDDEEVVPGEDRSTMLTCTKIWDRLQGLEKFRNGEIDVDNLCTQLRTKARCSEGGVVIDQKDVDDIMTRAT